MCGGMGRRRSRNSESFFKIRKVFMNFSLYFHPHHGFHFFTVQNSITLKIVCVCTETSLPHTPRQPAFVRSRSNTINDMMSAWQARWFSKFFLRYSVDDVGWKEWTRDSRVWVDIEAGGWRRIYERRYLALLFAFKDFFFVFLIRIPGWKNLTTVDKAIHINAPRESVQGNGRGRVDRQERKSNKKL